MGRGYLLSAGRRRCVTTSTRRSPFRPAPTRSSSSASTRRRACGTSRTRPMQTRLDALTSEQIAQLPVIRDHWLTIGLSTDPADRHAAEEGVRQAYRAAGLDAPAVFVWLSSPMAGAI